MRAVTATSVGTAVLLLLVSSSAAARETAAVDEEPAGAGTAFEDEALGERGNLRTRAEEVSFDARLRSLELTGNVRVDAAPFHLRSQRITLTRTRLGIEVQGRGSLAFCPCLGTPLKVDFRGAIVAPPGDLILERPTLRVYDVPILPLPYFWLRSDEKLGVLPPDIAYRGDDGFFVGGGIHVPWKYRGDKSALDLRSGAYLLDGFVVDARLRTPTTTTKVRFDRRPNATGRDEGLSVDARGAVHGGELGVAWDADVLRGERGVRATTDLDAAARPWDRAAIEGALRGGPVVAAVAMRAVTRRGGGLEDVDASGPVVTLRSSGSAGTHLTYDATVEGGSLRFQRAAVSRDALSYARAEVGVRGVAAAGPLELSLTARGAGDVTADAVDRGDDRAVSTRARVGLPLVRAFGAGPSPVVHVIEPFAEAAVLHAQGDVMMGLLPARGGAGISGTAGLGEVGFTTTLGRWSSRDAVTFLAVLGNAFGGTRDPGRPLPVARSRLSASSHWVGASGDVASVPATPSGHAAVGRVRLGAQDGVRLLGNVAARSGLDPVLARALLDAPLEPAAGFLADAGTTGGAGLVVPWSRVVTTSVGADGDATRTEVVAVRGGVELRDRCGCLTLRAMGSHRLGRDGVDVWIALDFAADR